MKPNTIIGKKYQILKTIGYGGMATVYLAEHIETKKNYAIKVLDPKYYQDDKILQRFKREASIGKALNHPNIPTFYGFELDKGLYYIVMEYVQGYNVRQYLKQYGIFSVKDATYIIKEVLKTLEYAYDNGITAHRDIKPENIMIDPKTKTVKVMDFGVSRMDDSTLTSETKIYTVKYASPEQLLPTRFPKGITDKSDLYSLGIVFYEMVTGKLPFEGNSQVDILEKELHFDVIPPNEINHELPQNISSVIMKSLLPNPDKRYQSSSEMMNDLISNISPKALPKKKSYGLQKKSPIVYWLASLLGVALILGTIFSWVYLKGRNYVNINVDSSPQGAAVFIDGVELSDTLTPTKISLSRELHNITIIKKGYKRDGSNLDLSVEKKKNIFLSFELRPSEENKHNMDGLLYVQSDPDSAKVFVDGIYVGDTPLKNFEIQSGDHSLYVSKKGYYNSKPGSFYVNKNVPGKEPYKTSLHLLLVKIPPEQKNQAPSKSPPEELLLKLPATLEIDTIPPGALVKINNEFVDTTPLIIQLTPEQYKVKIEKMGFESYLEDVTLEGDKEKTLNVSLVSKIGKPILLYPENESRDLDFPIEFTWEKAVNANHYRVYITNLETGYKVFGDKGQRVDANGFFVEEHWLTKGSSYIWMVNAFKDESEVEWNSSDQFEFSTIKEKEVYVSPTIRVYINAYDSKGNKIDEQILCYINDSFIDTLDGIKNGYNVKRNTKYTIRIGSEENYFYKEKTIYYTNKAASTQVVNFTLQHR